MFAAIVLMGLAGILPDALILGASSDLFDLDRWAPTPS